MTMDNNGQDRAPLSPTTPTRVAWHDFIRFALYLARNTELFFFSGFTAIFTAYQNASGRESYVFIKPPKQE